MKYRIEANRMNYSDDILDRFWSKVVIPENYINECWIWTACKDKGEYGVFTLQCWTKIRKQITVKSHRFVYESYYGSISDGLLVCHRCDNPKCVNPNHLFLGTYLDNVRDRISKDRPNNGPKGDDHHMSILSSNIVLEMLTEIINNKFSNINQICSHYDISRGTIDDILQGKIWKEITCKFNLTSIRSKILNLNLTNNDINVIKDMLMNGHSISAISGYMNRGETTIRRIKKKYGL